MDKTEIVKKFLDAIIYDNDFINRWTPLDKAAEEYAPDFSNSITSKAAVDAIRDAFKAGAKWMIEQGVNIYGRVLPGTHGNSYIESD